MPTLMDALKEIMQKAMPQPQNTGVGPTLANAQTMAQPQPQQNVANQVAPAPVAPVPQPQPGLPAAPNFGTAPTDGGGFKGFLKDTLAEIVPAATQVAIWGPGEFGQRMAYNKLTSHLQKKKEDEEKQKEDMIAQLSIAHAGMRKYLKANKLDPDMYWYALTKPGTSTGNKEVDGWLQQMQLQIKPFVDSGKLGASDMLTSFKKVSEFEKIMEGEKPTEFESKLKMYETDPDKYKDFIQAGKEPKNIDPLSEEGISLGLRKQEGIAKINEAHRKPDKPETPTMREVWPTGGGESKWIRNDVAPPKGYTGIKPERAPKAPTPQQALKNIAQQEKIIYSLKNTGGIPPELLGNVSPETLKMLQGGDSTSAIQAAQDVIDYNKQFVQTEGAKQKTNVNTIKEGQTATNPKTGEKIIFKGGKWKPATK